MLVVFPYSLKDQKLAVNLAAWIRELAGGTTAAIGHNFLIVVDSRVDGLVRTEVFAKLKDLGNSNSVEEIVVTDDVDNKWPESPNLMIRKAAKHIEYGTKEPWLWIEPDVVPLKKSWLDEIEAEYKTSGKPFLGDFVHLAEPGFVDHMSGVAVYPGRISHFAGELVMAHSIAWDCYAAGQIIPQMHKSKLILHRWKLPPFESWEQVEQRIFATKPDCVLFHQDKSQSLLPLLRERITKSDTGFFSETFEVSEEAKAHHEKFPFGQFVPYPDCPSLLIAQQKPSESSSTATASVIVGTNGDTSREAIVRDAVAILRQLCTSPVHKGQIRKELKAQGVTK